jgi:tripartite-type tricarboxylate transporter receptor subunit TctC
VHDMMFIGKRGVAAVLVGACGVLLLMTSHAQATTWLARIIAPIAPGSSTDCFARGFAQYLQAQTGQCVFVENKSRDNRMIGSVSTHSLNSVIQKKLSCDPAKDFVEAGMFSVFSYDLLAVAYKSAPAVLNDPRVGAIDFTIMDAMSVIEGGLLRPVAVTSASRSALLPAVKALT